MEQHPKYPPPHHQIQDREKMIDLIRNYPLAELVTADGDEAFVTHIPIIYNEALGQLVAHIDKYNPQVRTLQDGKQATVVFKGPDTYISPGVYRSDQLPTWNYLIVHIKGRITLINEPERAKQTMIDMTAFLEGSKPRFVLEMDNPRMARAVNYIQAFTIDMEHWDGKFKLSQDKHPADGRAAKQEMMDNSRASEEEFIERMYK
ncbi:FMN-binding negative transcriptional regulator [Aureitalea marina]|uniref:Transcriptional regulator n=1 Tax=Aureitalea marina TaxID=930804 RepID=A0A2S7KQR4_9FLAO|nr:FMN-binding negative transcriptional regulator [Aureitalea marina]PQB04962.1 transcriptional regulator [Aureitalea marina]